MLKEIYISGFQWTWINLYMLVSIRYNTCKCKYECLAEPILNYQYFYIQYFYNVNCHGNGPVLYVSGMKLTIIYDQIIWLELNLALFPRKKRRVFWAFIRDDNHCWDIRTCLDLISWVYDDYSPHNTVCCVVYFIKILK